MLAQPPKVLRKQARDYSERQGHQPKVIVLHHTGGTSSLGWLSGNPKHTSIHWLVERDGTCYRMVDDQYAAHHVGFSKLDVDGVTYSEHGPSPNLVTFGIELENVGNGKEIYPEIQLRAAAWIVQTWWNTYGKLPVVMHRDIDQYGKNDAFGISIHDVLHFIAEDEAGGGTSSPAITGDSTILAAPRATEAQAANYTIKRGVVGYTPDDVRLIAGHYWRYGQAVGIDPCVAWAQMVHETDGLRSWWSQRQRRNPAGIGVTGQWSRSKTQPGPDWTFDDQMAAWKQGWSFATWDEASKAHLGHLLVYAVGLDKMNPIQREMAGHDPRLSAVPKLYHGCAPTLAGLNGRWAVPGTDYNLKIAAIAESIRVFS